MYDIVKADSARQQWFRFRMEKLTEPSSLCNKDKQSSSGSMSPVVIFVQGRIAPMGPPLYAPEPIGNRWGCQGRVISHAHGPLAAEILTYASVSIHTNTFSSTFHFTHHDDRRFDLIPSPPKPISLHPTGEQHSSPPQSAFSP